MSEIEQLKAQVQGLLGKVATMEAERSGNKQAQGIDPAKLVQSLVMDPIGTFKQLGMKQEQIDHVKTVGIADYLGPNAPLQMQIAAASGPSQIAAQQNAAAIADLSRQVASIANSVTIASKRNAFNAIPDLSKKAPNLSKMLAVDPASIQAGLDAHGGSVEEFITAEEAKYAKLAAAFNPNAASTTSENTVDTNGQSVQPGSAPLAGSLNDTPPPKSNEAPEGTGKWDRARYEATKERLVREANKQMGIKTP